MKNFTLIIPIFNEDKNIDNLFIEIINTGVYNLVKEIIFVDDKSTDNSREVIQRLQKKYSKVILISHETNKGQSSCLFTGINSSKSPDIITIDGDGQNCPNDIINLINIYSSNYKYCLIGGIRKKRQDSLIKRFSSYFANYVRRNILDDECKDTGCSLKIFKKKIFLSFPFFDGIHRFLPALFKAYGCKMIFIDVEHRPRIYGVSKYGIIDRLFAGIRDIIKVLKIIRMIKNNRD